MTTEEKLFKDLNLKQQEAVRKTEGPLLILAGAGSGKTRVITYRIAYLISLGIEARRILAVTFTNKAAQEMTERVKKLVGSSEGLWIGTFHSICVRILRRNIDRLGYRPDFLIYDTHDQIYLIKECLREMNLSEKEYRPQAVLSRISSAKNELIGPQEFSQWIGSAFEQKVSEIFSLYQKKLKHNNALDFDDIILNTVLLFLQNEHVLKNYHDQFQYILVDEYQDTNHAQYRWIHLLARAHQNLCVVGDPDQAIYRWRGADFTNLLKFEEDYPGTTQIVLDENYRSTKNILQVSNHLIRFNKMRKEKNLWTKAADGDPVYFFGGSDEHEEVDFVINTMERLKRTQNISYQDMVVFYRVHAQSRVFEDGLRRSGIAYQIVGGVSFYQRKEIKDVVSFLRLIEGTGDTVSFQRVVNIPPRGIGDATLEKFESWRQARGLRLWEALQRIDELTTLSAKSRQSLKNFAKIIDDLKKVKDQLQVPDLVLCWVEKIGYFDELKKSDPGMGEARIENVKEFVSFAEEYILETPQPSLLDFLERISLVSDIDQWDEKQERATLMTLHSAKGLEFPVVFIVGLEEGLCPHSSSRSDPMELEEERRLFYVGMTRSQKKLFLSCAESRLIYGRRAAGSASRFLDEIPRDLVKRLDLYDHEYHDDSGDRSEEPDFVYELGQRVLHPVFGIGEILEVDGAVDGMKVRVAFEKNPSPKWLMAKFARLTPL